LKHILVVGSINMDVVLEVPHIPAVGETVLSKAQSLVGGGKGANQAITAARLGAKVSMIGRVGADTYGQQLLESLKSSGVNVQGVEVDGQAPSGVAYICVSPDGENSIVVNSGANGRVDVAQIDGHKELFDQVDYCLLQMEIPLETVEYVLKLCRAKGVKAILNPAPAHQVAPELLEGLYILAPNESELKVLCGTSGRELEKMAWNLREQGVENVIVTLGGEGCLAVLGNKAEYYPAQKFPVVDTTGAGDSFVGGLTVGLAEGMDFPTAIRFASFVAGLTVSKAGAQTSFPDRATVDHYFGGDHR